jgi:GntR family transcriptional regulator
MNKRSGDSTPVYLKLQTKIQSEIENGRLSPGDSIPPENELAQMHQVSVGTVKKAILNLANEGYLYRVQGRGTFVAGTTVRRESLRYYCCLNAFGSKEASLKIKFLELKKIDGIEQINRYLKIRHNQGLYELRRLFISNKKPLVYCVSYLPQKLFSELETFKTNQFERFPLYLFLEKKYGLPTILNRELIGTVKPDEDVSKILKVPQGTSVLFIEMISFTYRKKPYEYRQSYCITDTHKFFREY